MLIPLQMRTSGTERGTVIETAYTTSPLYIGRNPQNDLVVPSPYISQWHAIVEFDERETRYTDIGSANGTVRTRAGRLEEGVPTLIEDGETLVVGPIEFTISRGVVAEQQIEENPTLDDIDLASLESSLGIQEESATSVFIGDVTDEQEESATSVWTPDPETLTRLASGSRGSEEADEVLRAYERYRALRDALIEKLMSLGPEAAHLVVALKEIDDPQLQRFLSRIDPGSGKTADASRTAIRWLANTYVKHLGEPRSDRELAGLVSQIAKSLEVFGAAFDALFRRPTGALGESKQPPTLAGAKGTREVLAYLLDWRPGANERFRELERAFKSIMARHSSTIETMLNGTRHLVADFAPARLDRELDASPIQLGPLKIPRKIWPFRGRARWRLLHARVQELTDLSVLSARIFGDRANTIAPDPEIVATVALKQSAGTRRAGARTPLKVKDS